MRNGPDSLLLINHSAPPCLLLLISAVFARTRFLSPQDVPLVGLAGDAVDVSRGFARNFLIPQRLATPTARKDGKGVTEEATVAPQREVVLSEADEAREAVRLLTATPLVRAGLVFFSVHLCWRRQPFRLQTLFFSTLSSIRSRRSSDGP